MLKKIKQLFDKKISASGLGVFRILYFLVLFFEVRQITYFKELIFDYIPFVWSYEVNFGPALIIWQIVILLLVIGFYTRVCSIINYVFSIVFLGAITTFEYHVFYAYMGINFLCMFLSIHKSLSIDALREKLKYSNTRVVYEPNQTTSALNYLIPVFVGIGLVYADSVLFKLSSHHWMRGLGVWLPATLPHFTHLNFQWFLNQKWIMLIIGYYTLVFETVFLFTFWRKNTRVLILISGILLHLGIYFVFPIPYFAYALIALYMLMVPVGYWHRIRQFIIFKKPLIYFFYDEECPLCVRTRIIIKHFDISEAIGFKGVQSNFEQYEALKDQLIDDLLDNVYSIDQKGTLFKGYDTYSAVFSRMTFLWPLGWLMKLPVISSIGHRAYAFVANNRITERCTESNCGYVPPQFPTSADNIKLLRNLTVKNVKVTLVSLALILTVLLQLNVSYKSGILGNSRSTLVSLGNPVVSLGIYVSDYIHRKSQLYLGITAHPVFMDFHLREYNHIIGITCVNDDGTETWLPIINEDGMPGPYNSGFNWVKWTFRVNSPKINSQRLSRGLKKFCTFWACKNNVDLSSVHFKIKVKKVKSPGKWEKDFLKQQISQPWIDAGVAGWEGGKFRVDITDIEKI